MRCPPSRFGTFTTLARRAAGATSTTGDRNARNAAPTASQHGSQPGQRSDQSGTSGSGLANLKLEAEPAFPGGYDASKYADLSVDPALKKLFTYIGMYKPEKRELATELKPFIPDYIAAVGDVDEFLKPPRPDGEFEPLGLKVLDEPSMHQSDPVIMRKFLRAHMTGTAAVEDDDETAIQHGDEERDAKIDQWIKDVDRLRDVEVTGEVWIDLQVDCIHVHVPIVAVRIGNVHFAWLPGRARAVPLVRQSGMQAER